MLITYHGRIYTSQYSLPQKFHLQVFITPHNMLIIPGSTSKDKCFWKINNIVVKIWERWSINKYEELKSNIPLHHFFFSCSWSNNKCLKLTSVLGGTSAYIQVNIPTPENRKKGSSAHEAPPIVESNEGQI